MLEKVTEIVSKAASGVAKPGQGAAVAPSAAAAPVAAAAADYCENVGIITLLLTYPARLDTVALFTSTMYIIKSAFSTLSFIALFAALAGWVLVVLKGRRARSPRD
jgi:hypothetical protein